MSTISNKQLGIDNVYRLISPEGEKSKPVNIIESILALDMPLKQIKSGEDENIRKIEYVAKLLNDPSSKPAEINKKHRIAELLVNDNKMFEILPHGVRADIRIALASTATVPEQRPTSVWKMWVMFVECCSSLKRAIFSGQEAKFGYLQGMLLAEKKIGDLILRSDILGLKEQIDKLIQAYKPTEKDKNTLSSLFKAFEKQRLEELRGVLQGITEQVSSTPVPAPVPTPAPAHVPAPTLAETDVTIGLHRIQKPLVTPSGSLQPQTLAPAPVLAPAPAPASAPASTELGVTIGLHRVPNLLAASLPRTLGSARALTSLEKMFIENVKEELKGLDLEEKKIDEFARSFGEISRELKRIDANISVNEKETCLATIKANVYRLKEIASLVDYKQIDSIVKPIEEKIEKTSEQFITKEYVKSKLIEEIKSENMPKDEIFTADVVEAFGKIFLEIEARNITRTMLQKDREEKHIIAREFHNRNYRDLVSHLNPICDESFEKLKKLSQEENFVKAVKLIKNKVDFKADMVTIDSSKYYLNELGFQGKMPEDKYLFGESVNELLCAIAKNFEKVEHPSPEDNINDLLEEVNTNVDELEKDLDFGVTEEQENEASDHPDSVIENSIAFTTLGLTTKEVKNTAFKGSVVLGEVIEFIKNKTVDCFKRKLENLGFSGKMPEYTRFFPDSSEEKTLIAHYHEMVDTLVKLDALSKKNEMRGEESLQTRKEVDEQMSKIETSLKEIETFDFGGENVFASVVKFVRTKKEDIGVEFTI